MFSHAIEERRTKYYFIFRKKGQNSAIWCDYIKLFFDRFRVPAVLISENQSIARNFWFFLKNEFETTYGVSVTKVHSVAKTWILKKCKLNAFNCIFFSLLLQKLHFLNVKIFATKINAIFSQFSWVSVSSFVTTQEFKFGTEWVSKIVVN